MTARTLAAAGLGFLLALAAGCSDADPLPGRQEAPRTTGGGRLFAVSFQTMNNPFFVDLKEGLEEVIQARGDRLVVLDAQFNSLKQKNDLSDVVLQGVAALFVNPVNWQGIRGSLLQARERGIPVIVVDAPVEDQELIVSTVASDNVEAGRLAARALAAAVNPARVGLLRYSINKACLDRVQGFQEELARHPHASIVDVQEGKGTTESARPVMRDMIGRHPDINAVFAINDPAALGVISALESAGRLEGVKVAAVDGAPEAVRAILAGRLLATSAQFPREIGRLSALAAYRHLDGQPVEKEIKVKVELITRDNASSFLAGR